MYAPLGALSAFGQGALEGYDKGLERQVRQWDMQGMEALGRAFQQGPIDLLNQRGPQPPMPGQPSTPAMPQQRMAEGPGIPGSGPPMPSPSGPAPFPPGAAPAPGAPSPSPAPGAGSSGLPQFDLQTLATRIRSANPDLPPQAMVSALSRAAPLLNMQGRYELAQLRHQMQTELLDYRRDALEAREKRDVRALDQKDRALNQKDRLFGLTDDGSGGPKGLMTPDAIERAAERYLKTGTMPPNLGRGIQGRADMAAIQNRAAELAKERNISSDDLLKNQQKFKAEQIAIQRFMSGPQGNTIRSLNVVVDHLATMRDLAVALQNGNMQVFNRLAQGFAEQTGQSAPTNFDTAKQIVGAEIIKALGVAGAGTQSERAEAANAFARARSPEQLMGAIKVAQKLLTGQLGGMRQQFVKATGLKAQDFDDLLLPEAKGFLGRETPAAKSGGWSIQRID